MAAGRKTGGRQKGARNKKTAARLKAIAASGLAPLDYMLKVMRDPGAKVARRDEMAKAAAPYVHPRLAALTNPKGDGPPTVRIEVSDTDRAKAFAVFMARLKAQGGER